MPLPILYSVQQIKQQFHTGEEPVLVLCSDVNIYVCKYMRSSASAYKLACELIGARMAMAWKLNTPDIALVKIKDAHWQGVNLSHSLSAPSLGCRWLDSMVDITPSTYAKIPISKELLSQLMQIALFDFWIANEDRNANNANLMYDVVRDQLVSIDYGCIFNTATFDYPLSQLTSTDTILWSDLFHRLTAQIDINAICALKEQLKKTYEESLQSASLLQGQIIEELPQEWNIPKETVKEKLQQLFDKNWTANVWNNFIECLNENVKGE